MKTAYAELKDGQAVVKKCPFCGERHVHSPENGHRVAHCANGDSTQGYNVLICCSCGVNAEYPVVNGFHEVPESGGARIRCWASWIPTVVIKTR